MDQRETGKQGVIKEFIQNNDWLSARMKTLPKIALKMGKVKATHCVELIRQD